MKKTIRVMLIATILSVCMLFACACGNLDTVTESVVGDTIPDVIPDDDVVNDVVSDAYESSSTLRDTTIPTGEYNKGVVLVKYDGALTSSLLGDLDVKSVEQLFKGSKWHTILLEDGVDTEDAVKYLHKLDVFETVDYDYVMKSDGDTVDISGNTYAEDLTYLDTMGVKNGWEHNANNKKYPGGSADVVIAIIDTGVDYNHIDLRNNIWVNSAEIPGNGIDDDGNGYVDDVNGWNCVGDNNDPMDDNGHGTHVAGIAAAENNKTGTVGVAYNCKIMCLKAGNSSGYFNNSDIAEAIQYAYMNGASVINMSFGGSSISIAVEDALMDAYNQCVLVAAAGNESLCNNLSCPEHAPFGLVGVSYPAALPYVIGVMSCNANGTTRSAFSNFDHAPYGTVEYEVYACGEQIPSTWPNNKYATLSGTSMACPVVAGIAAVLRSTYPDREVYSNKYIQSQIVNTGTKHAFVDQYVGIDEDHAVADLYEALTYIPKPNVNLYDFYIFDNVEFSAKNNGNGVVDAGETIHLAVDLKNIGGVASNVNVTIDTIRNGDASITDPYFNITTSAITLSDIGTYSVRDGGKIYTDGVVTDVTKCFVIEVDDDCPNDYIADFNVHFTYKNGLDEDDDTVYTDDGRQTAQFGVSRGFHLPSTITEDTTYTADRLYIVGQDVIIPEGVTVTFEEGCEIQFYDDREYYNAPGIIVYGTLYFVGKQNNMITIRSSEQYSRYRYGISVLNSGELYLNYVDAVNMYIVDDPNQTNTVSIVNNSCLNIDGAVSGCGEIIYQFQDGHITANGSLSHHIDECYNSYLNLTGYWVRSSQFGKMNGNYIIMATGAYTELTCRGEFTDNIFFSKIVNGFSYVGGDNYFQGEVRNNFFLSSDDGNPKTLLTYNFLECDNMIFNTFSLGYQKYANQVIRNYNDAKGNPTVDVYDTLADASLLWPHVVNVEMFDKDGNPITTVGKEEIKVRVTFNRAMDKDAGTFVTFGTREPYADYCIDGEFISDTVWEGTYTLKAQIENGQNFLKVNNAWAAEDQTKTVFGEYQLHEFDIDTTAAMAMNLQANVLDNGIQLTFAQDDYDTLLGYNIYRSEEKDGNYVKLNPAILLPTDSTFLDENAKPGKTYWYTYTVVLTDFTESNPAGKVVATAKDTMAPNMYHTPVNQGYLNNNLVISCTASDNVAITSVVLYYRTVGATEWKTITMLKQNDKYSATIFGSELTLEGLEYYIVANDTFNSISKGSAETPYTVVIKDASAISRKGDVDGDGVVTTKDALMIMQCINGDLIMTDDEFKRADLNSDGVLSSMEALRILQYINGNVTTLEM